MAAQDSSTLIDVSEVARRIGISRSKVDKMVKDRLLPAIRLSKRCVRYNWPAVEAALAKVTVTAI